MHVLHVSYRRGCDLFLIYNNNLNLGIGIPTCCNLLPKFRNSLRQLYSLFMYTAAMYYMYCIIMCITRVIHTWCMDKLWVEAGGFAASTAASAMGCSRWGHGRGLDRQWLRASWRGSIRVLDLLGFAPKIIGIPIYTWQVITVYGTAWQAKQQAQAAPWRLGVRSHSQRHELWWNLAWVHVCTCSGGQSASVGPTRWTNLMRRQWCFDVQETKMCDVRCVMNE